MQNLPFSHMGDDDHIGGHLSNTKSFDRGQTHYLIVNINNHATYIQGWMVGSHHRA